MCALKDKQILLEKGSCGSWISFMLVLLVLFGCLDTIQSEISVPSSLFPFPFHPFNLLHCISSLIWRKENTWHCRTSNSKWNSHHRCIQQGHSFGVPSVLVWAVVRMSWTTCLGLHVLTALLAEFFHPSPIYSSVQLCGQGAAVSQLHSKAVPSRATHKYPEKPPPQRPGGLVIDDWLVLGSWCLVAGVEPQHNVDYLERPLRKCSAFMIRLVLMSLLLALNLPLSRKSCGSNLRHVHTPTVRNLGTLWKSPSYMFFVVWIHLMTPQSSTHMPRSTG